jgi:hypothetical protein
VPNSSGSKNKSPCPRISIVKDYCGLDVQACFRRMSKQIRVTTGPGSLFCRRQKKFRKADFPFAMGLGKATDSVDWVGALFAAYRANLIDPVGTSQVKSDAVLEVLEYSARLVKALPDDAVSHGTSSPPTAAFPWNDSYHAASPILYVQMCVTGSQLRSSR